MSRKTLERRRKAEKHWPLLGNILSSHFSQDFEIIDGSLGQAIEKATQDGSIDDRCASIEEWINWNSSEGTADDIRPFLKDGFGVEVFFETELEARKFMNQIYDGLKSSLKAAVR